MGIGIKELLVILIIIVLLFGTKKLKNLGSDLGSAVKGFRKAMGNPDVDATPAALEGMAANEAAFVGNAEEISEKK